MKKKFLAILGVIGAICIMGGAYALFSGTATTKQNTFTIVPGQQNQSGAIEIIEENWNPANATALEPGEIVEKDPYTSSKAEYKGYIVMAVSVPTISARMGSDTSDKTYEVCDLLNVDTTNFKLLEKDTSITGKVVYYYGYKNVVDAKGQTTVLFDKIQIKNFTSISSKVTKSVDVDAYIIQHIDPSTGEPFTSVDNAYATIGKFVS